MPITTKIIPVGPPAFWIKPGAFVGVGVSVAVGVRVGVGVSVGVSLGVGERLGVGVLVAAAGVFVDVGEPGVEVALDPVVGVGEAD